MGVVGLALNVKDYYCPATGAAHVWIGEDGFDWCGCGVNRHTDSDGEVWYSRRR